MAKNDNIRLSKKYGLNSSIIVCPLCNKDQHVVRMLKTDFDKSINKEN